MLCLNIISISLYKCFYISGTIVNQYYLYCYHLTQYHLSHGQIISVQNDTPPDFFLIRRLARHKLVFKTFRQMYFQNQWTSSTHMQMLGKGVARRSQRPGRSVPHSRLNQYSCLPDQCKALSWRIPLRF